MKKAYQKELQAKLLGSISDSPDALSQAATDRGIFQIEPSTVVYPANTADVRKIAQFAHEKTAAGRPVHLTPRGLGAGQGGGALGEDTQLILTPNMNRLLRLDHDSVTVQAGITFRTLQQTLHTHARFIPAAPPAPDFASVGAAVSENIAGTHSVKYGSIRAFVKKMKVVLSDGSLLQVHRLTGRELNRKKGLSTLEGELYRKLDSLILDHSDSIRRLHQRKLPYDGGGFGLEHVRGKDGSFDLGQIFVGAQGSLGVVTEVTLKTAAYNPRTSLVVGYFESTYAALEAAAKIKGLGPSALELADRQLFEAVATSHPGYLDDLLPDNAPYTVLLVQFDQFSQFSQRLATGRTERIVQRYQGRARVATDPVEQLALWKLRFASNLYAEPIGTKRPLPFLAGALVPVAALPQLVEKVTKLLKKYELTAAIWGHVGDGNLDVVPRLDLSKKKDADKLFNLARDYAEVVAGLGGSLAATSGDSLLSAASYSQLYGEDVAELWAAVKHMFDPQEIFSPHHKTASTSEYARQHLRTIYNNPMHYQETV
jgi:FAD/FMN-containing dehydrogenase